MTKKFTIFFLTLLLLLSLPSLQAQESLVLPYKSEDGLWFFFVVQKDNFQIPLRNNSFLDRPSLYIYVAGPKLDEPKQIQIQFTFYEKEIIRENNTERTIYKQIEQFNQSLTVYEDFTQYIVQLPIYQNETILIIKYNSLKIAFRYRVNPLYLKSQQEILAQRITGYVILAITILIIVILSMYLARRILDRIKFFPGDPIILLIITAIVGFMAYSYIQNLQYLDPATYVSLSEFLVNNYNVLLMGSAFFVSLLASLYIFRQKPDQLLFFKFKFNKVVNPETKEMTAETQIVDILHENIRAPSNIWHFILYLLGIRQKLVFEDEWYIMDQKHNFKRIYLLDQDFSLSDLKIEINWKYALTLLTAIILIITKIWLFVIAGIILIVFILYQTKDKKKRRIEGDKEIIEEIPGVKIVTIKNRELKVKLAPSHYKRLFSHFYELLSKKALLDEAYQARKQVTILLSEKEIEKLEALRDYTDIFLTKFKKLVEGERNERNGERA